jgi:succinoglycan biosynthesis transport protein ExoP
MNSTSTPPRVSQPRTTNRDSPELQPGDILRFLSRRRYLLLTAAILGASVGFVAYLLAPRLYTSTATAEMSRNATSGLGLEDFSGVGSMGLSQDFMTDMVTQQAVLSNGSTALSVIERLNLMSTPPYSQLTQRKEGKVSSQESEPSLDQSPATRDAALGIFRNKLQVKLVKNTRLLTVSYTDPDPLRASQVANGVIESYLANYTKTRYDATVKASTWLNEQLTDLKLQAEDDRKQLTAMEQKDGIVSLSIPSSSPSSSSSSSSQESAPSEQSLVANPDVAELMNLNQYLSQAELARIQQGTIYRLTQTSDPNALLDVNGPKLALGEGTELAANGESMGLLQTLRNQESTLKLRLAAEKVTYAAKNPVIVELQSQLNSVHTQIVGEMERLRSQAKKNYELAQQNEDVIRKQLEQQKQKVSALSNKVATFAFLQQQEGTSRKLYQDLYTRLQEADITAGVRSSGISVVDPARIPSALSSPDLKKDLVFGLAGGLFIGFLAGIILQLRDNTLNVPEEFEEHSPYPLLGVIPGFDVASRALFGNSTAGKAEPLIDNAWILREPKSQLSEAYRQIRTSILLSSIDQPPKVILFTSPVCGDGKSTSAYNLAVAFAAQSAKVLILNADMRKPSMGKLAGLTPSTGLSDILAGGNTFDEVVQVHAKLPTLHILLAGTIPPDPAELLGSKRFANLIAQLRERFDYILIDAPPVLLVTDPVVVYMGGDAVIVVLRAGKTQKQELRRFWTTLDKTKAHVLGFILNDFNPRLQGYGYGYGESYGYSKAGGYYSDSPNGAQA